jgi:hypothetical protein
MQRIISIFISALGGASGGYTAHQFLSRKDDPDLNQQLVIGAPLTVVVAAGVLGLLAGRRGQVVAFLAGLIGGTLLGTRLDDAIPGVAEARSKAMARLERDTTAV